MQKDQKVGFTQNKIANNEGKEHFTQNETAKSNEKEQFTQNETAKNNEKERFTQNETTKSNEKDSFTQNKTTNTQNYEAFTQDLIAKQLQNTQNEQNFNKNHHNFEQKEEELKELEQDLKEFEKELKEEREDLYEQRWSLVRSQEELTSKLLDIRDKDFTIRQLKKEMLKFSNDFIEKDKKQSDEIYKLEQKNNRDAEKYKDKISELENEKRKLLYRLDKFENTLKDLKFSSKSLNNNVEYFISKNNEKTILDQIEPFLPAILTLLVLLIKDKKIVETIKKEFLSIFKKPERENKNSQKNK